MKRMRLSYGSSDDAPKTAGRRGRVLSKFHQHGDTSAYDAMVRMAQAINERYPLINGEGTFGSRDGDSGGEGGKSDTLLLAAWCGANVLSTGLIIGFQEAVGGKRRELAVKHLPADNDG